MSDLKTVIIGAGPAGLGCAYTLAVAGRHCLVVDNNSQPGGICRTINYNGYLFDIGGHRFLTKSKEVDSLWHDIMGDDFMKVKRISRIYYKKKLFNYPLTLFDVIRKLGIIESSLCLISYLRRKLTPCTGRKSFEQWIINNFGDRLYRMFFKSYTEKVWAVPCKDISANWAHQRIRGLSLKTAINNALFKNKKDAPTTLSEEFYYPKTGPGEFCGRLAAYIGANGSTVIFNRRARKVRHNGARVSSVSVINELDGSQENIDTGYLFSSMPLPELMRALDPMPPIKVLDAADRLKFRDFISVNLIINTEHIFPDQWIYIQDAGVRMGRIQNYKNWSPAMILDPKKTSLGLEYFCNKNDPLYSMNSVEIINFALSELEKLGIADRKRFIAGFVARQENAYPFYSVEYENDVAIIRNYLSGFNNLQTVGRAGLFRYDNSDHALLTGIYAARNFLGNGDYNIWNTPGGGEYLES